VIGRGLKILFVASILAAIAITLGGGYYTYEAAPPYPGQVVTENGQVLLDKEGILTGQAVWQKYGLMDLGSVWGHGTYRGTEFTADTLHRMGQSMRDFHAQAAAHVAYADLPEAQQRELDYQVIQELRKNRYDRTTDTLVLTPAQVFALQQARDHYEQVFGQGSPETNIQPRMVAEPEERKALADFFFWTAWCAGTQRPGKDLTYTNNWPPDRSVGNEIAPAAIGWSIGALLGVMLAAGLALMAFFRFDFHKDLEGLELDAHAGHKILNMPIAPSQRKAAKYFLVVVLLFFLQLNMGGLMAHYTVHPSSFYGQDWVAKLLTYPWIKSWHLQLAIFWIAVAWVGSALYLGPVAGGREPRKQGLLVDVLFGAILLVAVGALAGTALGVKGLAGKWWFWIGHQGWEFLELGRLWQILLFVGLVIWLVLVVRAVRPHLARGQDRWGTVPFYSYSAIAVVSFFAFGLFYTPRTHITIADFWRWWVVHTWVEGIFEFFAAAAMAYVVTALGLAPRGKALRAAYLTACLAMFSGIIGVGHHYYWFGDPDLWFALGGVISAMEPVPILLLLVKVALEAKDSPALKTAYPYKWPLVFLGASSLWAFLGAGVFGFIITTPVINYYEHSTYLTMNHGHAALFGTYGMLAIGLMLFALRGLVKPEKWSDGLLKLAFGLMNSGLFVMAILTLFPVGLLQTRAAYIRGLWYARSPAFYNEPWVQFIGQWRIIPDLIIITGALALVIFVVRAMFNLKPATVRDGELLSAPAASAPHPARNRPNSTP
jgi:nitric oxide reductase subunit B